MQDIVIPQHTLMSVRSSTLYLYALRHGWKHEGRWANSSIYIFSNTLPESSMETLGAIDAAVEIFISATETFMQVRDIAETLRIFAAVGQCSITDVLDELLVIQAQTCG